MGDSWPALSSVAVISGRVATEDDVKAGHAVFVARDGDGNLIGTPLDIQLPQYAVHVD